MALVPEHDKCAVSVRGILTWNALVPRDQRSQDPQSPNVHQRWKMGTSVSTLLVACKMQKKKKSTYMCVCVCDLWAYLFALKGLKASRITPRIRAYWSYRIRTASFLLVPTPVPGFVQDSGPQARAVSFFRAWGLRDRGMTVFLV